jgi:glycosyltransferase involved in cell wall biosynthesis
VNIFFVFSDSFPASTAYSNRIHSLAKGLTGIGNEVEVSIVYPGNKDRRISNISKNGYYQGVKFKYYCFLIQKPKYVIFRNLLGVLGIFNFSGSLIIEHFRKKIHFVILCSSGLWHIVPLFFLSKVLGFRLLREKNEYPKFILNKQIYFAAKSRYKFFDGFIFMTETLEKYFTDQLGFHGNNIVIPMTVDISRFIGINTLDYGYPYNYITLVGDVLGSKDGVLLLLDSFARLVNKFCDFRLRLVGEIYSKTKFETILHKIELLNISDKVEFVGRVSREDIPEELHKAYILVLPRPTSLQSESGFPTKLGEYLASGKPVVVTRTGEIEKYIENEKHAYLVDPDDSDLFAEAISYVILNYDEARKVGEAGRMKAQEIFNLEIQAKKLNNYLENFN